VHTATGSEGSSPQDPQGRGTGTSVLIWRVARRARPVLLVLAASVIGLWNVTVALTAAGPILNRWPLAAQILVVNGAKIVPLALTAAALLRCRVRRDDAALRVGRWRAPTGLRLAGRALDWRWLGTAVAVIVCAGTVASGVGGFTAAGLRAAMVWFPVYAAAALINSAAEEFIFRHAVYAVLRPLIGRSARIGLTAAYFGLAHIHGTPSGLAGVMLTGAFGVVLALAIEQTRGFCWNWTLHFLGDLAIFFTLVASAT
jgi:membrane protease YdiL (CAAX protease family)